MVYIIYVVYMHIYHICDRCTLCTFNIHGKHTYDSRIHHARRHTRAHAHEHTRVKIIIDNL